MKIKQITSIIILAAFASCNHQPKPEMTQLEIRQQETKTFEIQDQKLVMKTVLNVLQDDGFIVKNIAYDLGFVMATKEVDIETSAGRYFATSHNTRHPSWDKLKLIEVTINVSEFGSKTKIRANFQEKVLNNHGSLVTIKPVRSDEFYQDFFSKIHKGIFIDENEI